jgi:zinc protease
VNPTNIDEAIEGIKEVLHRFRDGGVTAEELDRAKRFSVGSMALQLETNDGVAGAIADMVLYGLGLDYIDRYPAIVEGLTLDEVNQAASTHLPRFEETVVAVCGPPAA